ncbi:hypothetical protein M409DRAFT_55779 [Zasmidium cellare ATCC 36951]|uniref:2EXR domain-containing protein n=1 Tax=Zasmidium cellare ATCC 36951 TaxID=1080233 RepID=A0A6A6CDQ7_ZASCE|nr:uncharacterized protein M409DRAFT_55779 [Zasmidium cellare ATCC 36951]KAF2165367.1 hypothetical protein M409DRAFT_55779 [Zasmidium cellare ATCC 36951]
MATTTITETTRASITGKRKRNQVSYVVDSYFDDMDLDDEDAEVEEEDEDDAAQSEDDDTYGTAKKRGKTPAKKKARLTVSKPKKTKSVPPFRFLDLPAELRDAIYDLALTEPDGITLVPKTKDYRRTVTRGPITTQDDNHYYGRRIPRRRRYYWGLSRNNNSDSQTTVIGKPTRQLVPNLLAVNKQIRDEASSILYKQEIVIESTTALHVFIAQIGPYNRQLLSDITIKGWGSGRGVHKGHNFAALSILSTCTNLKSLFIDCTVGWLRGPQQLARQIFRDGHYFLEAFGAANGRYDAAVDILRFDDDWQFNKNARGRYYWETPASQDREADPAKKKEFVDELRSLLRRRK